jgi:hypothetical protein
MTHLVARAQALIDAGYKPVPVNGKQLAYTGDTPERDYNPAHFQEGMRIQVRAGHQPDGVNLYGFDLEGPSHGPQYNAERELAALHNALPHIAQKLRIVPSTNGDGRWLLFRSHKTLHSSQLFDGARKIGDFIGIGGTQRVPDPGNEPLAILTLTEIELLQAFWTFNHSGHADDPRHWTNRAAEGKRYVVGYTRHQVKRAQLRTFLREQCGKVGAHLDALFDECSGFDRSAAAGNLMQCLLFNIHKLALNAGYAERCALAYAYWLAADSYGKAADKDYNQQKDGCALLAAILHEDRKLNGGNWRAPFWAKAHPTPAAHPELEAAPAPRPAHRPAGDKGKQIAKLKRILQKLQFENAERIYYYIDDLAGLLNVKSRRAVQNYLAALAADNQIERGQDRGRGGRAWLILLPAFWGAQNSENAPEIAPESPAVWGAQPTLIEAITAPENADPAPQCKEDHQDLCAPPLEPEPAEPAGPRVLFSHGRWSLRWPDGAAQWFGSEDAARAEIEWGSTRAWLESDEGQAMLQRCAGGRRSRAVGAQSSGALPHEPRQHQVRALRNRLVLGKAARTVRRL